MLWDEDLDEFIKLLALISDLDKKIERDFSKLNQYLLSSDKGVRVLAQDFIKEQENDFKIKIPLS